MEFNELGLMPELLRALSETGYNKPTPIQQATIGVALTGRDIIGCAQTGTGKTAAFCLPALQRAYQVSKNETSLHTLILTPTRELAAQIGESIGVYGKHLDLYHTVIFGGVNEKPQIAELKRGVDLLVATPGRLLDLLQRKLLSLSSVQLFVLDEADRMLDMGFIHDVRKIVKMLPQQRQTMFFSATMPAAIEQLASSLVHNAARVAVDPVSSPVEVVTQSVYYTEKQDKRLLLTQLLKGEGYERVVVFTRTKHGADRVARHLEKAGLSVAAIHGNKAQNARVRALDGFRMGQIKILVATDIAARGIDVDSVSHVINFELPEVPETYVHRIGRTGRAGKGGIAISLCDADERSLLIAIERLMGKRLQRMTELPSRAAGASAGAAGQTDAAVAAVPGNAEPSGARAGVHAAADFAPREAQHAGRRQSGRGFGNKQPGAKTSTGAARPAGRLAAAGAAASKPGAGKAGAAPRAAVPPRTTPGAGLASGRRAPMAHK